MELHIVSNDSTYGGQRYCCRGSREREQVDRCGKWAGQSGRVALLMLGYWAGASDDQDNGCTRTAMLDIPYLVLNIEWRWTTFTCRLRVSISFKQLSSWIVSRRRARTRHLSNSHPFGGTVRSVRNSTAYRALPGGQPGGCHLSYRGLISDRTCACRPWRPFTMTTDYLTIRATEYKSLSRAAWLKGGVQGEHVVISAGPM